MADPKPELDPLLRPVLEDELVGAKVMAGSIRRTSHAEGGSGGVCTCWPGLAGGLTMEPRDGLSGSPGGSITPPGGPTISGSCTRSELAGSLLGRGLTAADGLDEVDQVGRALLVGDRPGHAHTPGDTDGGSRPAQAAHSGHSISAGDHLVRCVARSDAGAGLVMPDDPQQGERTASGAGNAVAPDSKGVARSIEAELASEKLQAGNFITLA
jgi:hypothetical protein